jgi:hypothetical protein
MNGRIGIHAPPVTMNNLKDVQDITEPVLYNINLFCKDV